MDARLGDGPLTAAPDSGSRDVAVVAAILIEDGCVLMTQRLPEDRFPLVWEFPGGKVDPGETHGQALTRELEEELAIQTQIGDRYDRLRVPHADGGHFDISFYFVERLGGEPQCVEVAAWEWASPSRLELLSLIPSNRPVVERLIRRLSGEDDTPR